jgi:uncharacterized protein YcaQ
MAGPVLKKEGVDGRVKHGHDEKRPSVKDHGSWYHHGDRTLFPRAKLNDALQQMQDWQAPEQ